MHGEDKGRRCLDQPAKRLGLKRPSAMARIGQPVEEWEGVLPLISLTRSQNDRQRAPEPVGDHANFERRSVHLTEVYRQKDLPLRRTAAAWSACGRPECWLRRLWASGRQHGGGMNVLEVPHEPAWIS